MTSNPRKASIKNVAEKAGVSIATVSHVLNDTRAIRAETRLRVLNAVQELGYSQNQAARNLVRGRSTFVGLIVSDVRNPFFPEITAAFQQQALTHDMDAMVLNTNYDPDRTLTAVRRLLSLQVPAVALLTSQIDPAITDKLAERRIAAVYLDLGRVGTAVSNIVVEYEHGIEEALDHLTTLGHRRIGYIGGPTHLASARRRKNAFLETAKKLAFDAEWMVDSDFTAAGGYLVAKQMSGRHLPSAIVAGNDLTAIGVMHWAFEAGLRIPEELSVVGFDDISFAAYTQPPLTTVAVPRTEIGRVAFETLWAMMADPQLSGRQVRLGTKLVLRQSTMVPLS